MSSVRARRAERRIVAAFVVATMAAVGAVIVYWRGGSARADGAMFFLAFVALGTGLIVWANVLADDGPHEQQREPLAADAADQAAVDAELTGAADGVPRRALLRNTLMVAGGAIGAAVIAPIRSLGPAPGHVPLHTAWADGVGVITPDGRPVRATDVPPDGLLTVFPAGAPQAADGQAVLVRVEQSLIRPVPGRESWTPLGLVAYSKVCTHAGCPVGLYQAETHQLLCPCHQSAFDVLHGARPMSGPAAWPLPQLPLVVDASGLLRAGGDFSAPVGPGWWQA